MICFGPFGLFFRFVVFCVCDFSTFSMCAVSIPISVCVRSSFSFSRRFDFSYEHDKVRAWFVTVHGLDFSYGLNISKNNSGTMEWHPA